MCNSIRGDYLLFTLCGDTMFAHFVVPILQRGAHFNLKILNDNCSSAVKCKCTVTECECPIDTVLNRIVIGNYISRQKRRTFLFFSHSMLSIRLVKNYSAFTFYGTPFRIIVHRRVEHFFCFFVFCDADFKLKMGPIFSLKSWTRIVR